MIIPMASPCQISWNSIFLITSSLLIILNTHNSVAAPVYVYALCPDMNTLSPNSKYLSNLNTLISSLNSNSTNENRFFNTTVGTRPNKVFGNFFCLVNGTTTACKECISLATNALRIRCPRKKASIIWYDQCLLRYSNESFFGSMEETPMIPLWNRENTLDIWDVTSNQTDFSHVMVDTLGDASILAANGGLGKKIATKEAKFMGNLRGSSILYTLAECTPDISVSECKNCLQMIIGNMTELCNGKAGCTLMCPSCNIRYEIYPFYGDFVATSPSPSPLGGNPKQATRRKHVWLVLGATIAAALVMLLVFGLWIYRCKRNSQKAVDDDAMVAGTNGMETVESLKFNFNTILKATNNFSLDKKLGEGGFGEVYKGRLENGQEVAIKRLSRKSKQGIAEFTTEVVLVAKLQHKNLVKLLGFCLARKEQILIYELLPNLSLDRFLSDPIKRASLDWKTRFKIIGGIAKGILYLHEDSRLKIVHRDLKCSNILLDGEMNPKIADFGMAKHFGVDQTQDNTNRIVGTFGYMAPEYLIAGHFSVKSDVYSFGIIVLEIVSGQRNKHFNGQQNNKSLIYQAWRVWNEGIPLNLVDSTLGGNFAIEEVAKCIHISLLCIQEDAAKRPRMTSIVATLNGDPSTLPSPRPPHFLNDCALGIKEICSDQCKSAYTGMQNITEIYPR